MDFLSFRLAFPSLEEGDYIVLNSVSNLQKAFSFLSQYDGIRCCLDNDTAGKNAVQALKDKYGIRICDLSHEYSGYKDLNEYLCGEEQSAPYLIEVLKRLPYDIPLFPSCHMWQKKTRVIFMW